MTAWELQPLRWWHLDEVLIIENDLFGSTAWSREQFYAELATPGRWLRVARDPDGTLGYVDVAVNGRDADLMTIAVAADAQGRGIGAGMLDAALAHARQAGAHHLLLEVRADNPARTLYASRGFAVLDVRRGYYGEGIDAVVMRRMLNGENGDHVD